jgi:putative N-acetylmannosamine-6-phosphate epimerase
VPESERLSSVYITPTFEDAAALAKAGCDVIAMDCTLRPRKGGATVGDIIARVHAELKKPVWADCATLEEGIAACKAGADIVSTTLSGYTEETAGAPPDEPDFSLLQKLVKNADKPVIMEGKIWRPEEVSRAFQLGAYAVVVGSAITRPQLITRRFVQAVPKS